MDAEKGGQKSGTEFREGIGCLPVAYRDWGAIGLVAISRTNQG